MTKGQIPEGHTGQGRSRDVGKEMVARGTKTRWQTPWIAGPGAELSLLRDSGGLPVPKHCLRAHLPCAGERGGTEGRGGGRGHLTSEPPCQVNGSL